MTQEQFFEKYLTEKMGHKPSFRQVNSYVYDNQGSDIQKFIVGP
jgi:hypothetical protein